MIISRTPFRISFAGGGSDLKQYYEKYGGSVVSTSINKYMYLLIHPYFKENEYLIKYSQTESVKDVNEIKHPITKVLFKKYGISGVDFNSTADIPAGTGLASSSAFTVGLINLLNAYTDKYMSKEEIARIACETEIEDLKEPIGKQDQYACACGGINFIEFQKDGTVDVQKICLSAKAFGNLENNLLMFYTGDTRSTKNILQNQQKKTENDKQTINILHKIVNLSVNLKEEICRENIDSMGEILHTGWKYKKELANGITNEKIDYYYDTAIKNGASGGKLLGAGSCGFLLFYVKDEHKESVRKALSNLNEINFKFDNKGTSIMYYDKINLYRKNS